MRFRYLALCVLACTPLVFLIFNEAHAVRLDNLILSSAVQGEILDHGKPVAGLRVQRTVHWNMEKEPRIELTTTNSEGRFQFPELRGAAEFGLLAKVFHVPTVGIEIDILTTNEKIMAYGTVRNSYTGYVETGLPEIRMTCDLKTRSVMNNVLPVVDCEVQLSEEKKNIKYE